MYIKTHFTEVWVHLARDENKAWNRFQNPYQFIISLWHFSSRWVGGSVKSADFKAELVCENVLKRAELLLSAGQQIVSRIKTGRKLHSGYL